jgi:hypothetical protein
MIVFAIALPAAGAAGVIAGILGDATAAAVFPSTILAVAVAIRLRVFWALRWALGVVRRWSR